MRFYLFIQILFTLFLISSTIIKGYTSNGFSRHYIIQEELVLDLPCHDIYQYYLNSYGPVTCEFLKNDEIIQSSQNTYNFAFGLKDGNCENEYKIRIINESDFNEVHTFLYDISINNTSFISTDSVTFLLKIGLVLVLSIVVIIFFVTS